MTPRTHNIVSYAVALVVMPTVVLARGAAATQFEFGTWLAVGLWCVHFSRRALEAAWVHRYSKPSLPLTDALIEYVYYWGFGTWIGWSLSTPSAPTPVAALWGGTALFVLAQLGNNKSHRMLAALRSGGGVEIKPIPHGFLFERVSCPHYLFEILSWLGFAWVTRRPSSVCFLLLGSGILGVWAWQRHSDYKQRFDGKSGPLYPRERRALVPWLF
ncbi:MAG: hypothetical protein JW940_26545 [Polyangiaceae bacterium]|nr:hypothetical protein [Polyangiaceae bacterium]